MRLTQQMTLQRHFKTLCAILLCMLMLMVGTGTPALASSSQDPVRIQSVQYNTSSDTIHVDIDGVGQYASDIQMVKVTGPDRMIIDIPNALLSTQARFIPVHNHGIDHIELSQSLGMFYQVARMTVYAQSPEALANAKLSPENGGLTVLLAEPQESLATNQPPLPSNHRPASFLDTPTNGPLNVLESLVYENGAIRLIGQNGSALKVKNQFTLTQPSRLVVDLADTVLEDKHMPIPIPYNHSRLIQNVRIGQFDENTVRIVIDTPKPSSVFVVYPTNDKSQLAFTTNLNPSIESLPADSQQLGTLEDINLIHRDQTSTIRLSANSPIVKRLVRVGNTIELDLINIAAKSTLINYDKDEFPDIQGMELAPLNATEPNTKLVITLNNPHVDMDSRMSLDGRILEISFSPQYNPAAYKSRRMPFIFSQNNFPPITRLKRGTFTVVVDAGHGGKDLGANRNGVYEKDLNLSVALKLKRELESRGVTVYMTRSSDMFLELSEITAITNRIHPDAFVSIHTNASVSSAADGIETYYYTPQSRALAYRVHHNAVNRINSPDRGVRTARFYVIHHTNVPAVLFEMGYISNPAERTALQSDIRQHATADAVAQGVVEFLGRSMTAEAPLGDEF